MTSRNIALIINKIITIVAQYFDLKEVSITEEEFRSQEPESILDSVRLVDESRFKESGFIRGEKKEFSFVETPDFRHGVF